MVVVMDSNGRVVNMNAMDMVLIWGIRAYPFSVSREDELWEEDGWSMQLLLQGIHPAFETWVNKPFLKVENFHSFDRIVKPMLQVF